MRNHTTRNSILAGIGLTSLLIYIMACTSFSPDDSKIAYPAFDDKSGAVCVSVYDRKSGKSEEIFATASVKGDQATNREPSLLRPQWLPDGQHILAAVADDKNLTLALLPYGKREPVRLLTLSGIGDGASVLMMPRPIIGSRVFLGTGQKTIARADLLAGEVRTREFSNEVSVYTSADAGAVFVLEEIKGDESRTVMSRLDPDTLASQNLMEWTNQIADGGFLAFSRDGSKAAFAEGREGDLRVIVMAGGKVEFSQPIGLKDEKVIFCPAAALSPKGDCVYAAFRRAPVAGTNASYGVVEFPLTGKPPRWTTLLTASGQGKEDGVWFFQPALSHDGKTLAVASTYLLLQDETVTDTDCALFLVDLGDPQRKVTKAKIAPPHGRQHILRK